MEVEESRTPPARCLRAPSPRTVGGLAPYPPNPSTDWIACGTPRPTRREVPTTARESRPLPRAPSVFSSSCSSACHRVRPAYLRTSDPASPTRPALSYPAPASLSLSAPDNPLPKPFRIFRARFVRDRPNCASAVSPACVLAQQMEPGPLEPAAIMNVNHAETRSNRATASEMPDAWGKGESTVGAVYLLRAVARSVLRGAYVIGVMGSICWC